MAGAVIVLLAAAYFYLASRQASVDTGEPAGGGQATTTAQGNGASEIDVFLIVLEGTQGDLVGEPVGCGDGVTGVPVIIPPTQGVMKAALERLFSMKDRDVKAGTYTFYNALYQSDVRLDSASVENGVATVRLSGKLVSGGVCDDPRIVAQIKKTVEQFPTVKSSKIFINNQPLESYFSGQ